MYRVIGADGQQYGPINTDQLRQWIAEGRVTGQTMAMAEGDSQWKPLAAFPEFATMQTPPAAPHGAQPITAAMSDKKPGKLQAIAIMTLISGILNCVAGLSWLGAGLIIYCVGVCFTIIPAAYLIVTGIMEIITATKLLPDPIRLDQPAKGIAILGIICLVLGSLAAGIMEIINLVFYNDPEVQAYFQARRHQ
jgi:Na+-translocating ferredoxin:NAD+ oxidoreductase RnfD subunit